MTNTRQIKGEKYNVAEMVTRAIETVDGNPALLNLGRAEWRLINTFGHKAPTAEMIARYARESAILNLLASETGAGGFIDQIGKIDFSSTATAIEQVNSYLNRRINGQRRNFSRRYQ